MKTKKSTVKTSLYTKRVLFYWLSFIVGYLAPLITFIVMFGVGKEKVSFRLTFPVLIAAVFLLIKVMIDLPKWTKTWQPSFAKGLVIGLPKIFIFGLLIMIYIIVRKEAAAFFTTIDTTVFVLSGCQIAGAILNAFHIKYKQLDLIEKGYVLGSINNE